MQRSFDLHVSCLFVPQCFWCSHHKCFPLWVCIRERGANRVRFNHHNTSELCLCVAEVDGPGSHDAAAGWMQRCRLTAPPLCLFPVPDNGSMQRGCPPGPAGGHQSSARPAQTLWKCPERCEAPDPRLAPPVVYQLSAAAQRPVFLLTTPLQPKLRSRVCSSLQLMISLL